MIYSENCACQQSSVNCFWNQCVYINVSLQDMSLDVTVIKHDFSHNGATVIEHNFSHNGATVIEHNFSHNAAICKET